MVFEVEVVDEWKEVRFYVGGLIEEVVEVENVCEGYGGDEDLEG